MRKLFRILAAVMMFAGVAAMHTGCKKKEEAPKKEMEDKAQDAKDGGEAETK